MGGSSSKVYDVGSKHKGIDGKSATVSKKGDSATLQLKTEVKQNIEAAKRRNEDISTSETATTSKNIDNKVTGNQEKLKEKELSIKAVEKEKTQAAGIRIPLKDDFEITTKTVETAQSEEIAANEGNPETRNASEGITPSVEELKKEALKIEELKKEELKKEELKREELKKEELKKEELKKEELKEEELKKEELKKNEVTKEEQEISSEIVETEISRSEETTDERKSQKMREEDIIEEMVRTVNHPKHDENAKSERHVVVSSVFTAEENYKRISEDNGITNVEVSGNAENIQKVEENINLKEKNENEEHIEDKVEVNENQEKQNEMKFDCNIQKVHANEETKKKVRIEIPNQNEKLRNTIEPKENDVRVENKIQIHTPEERVCENIIEDNLLVRKAEERKVAETEKAMKEPESGSKPIESDIHNEETKVDIEVCKLKKEHEGNNKDEEKSTQMKVEEQNQPENDTAVKGEEVNLKEDAIKENIQQMEETRTGNRTLESDEIRHEIPKGHNEETPEIAEKIPTEESLSSNHILPKKESGSIPGQTEGFEEISKDIKQALLKIQEIEEDTKALKERIISLTDTDKAEYFTLHEALIKNILKLDDLSGETGGDVRSERKRVIKFVQDCLNTLERNVGQPKDSDDSDAEL